LRLSSFFRRYINIAKQNACFYFFSSGVELAFFMDIRFLSTGAVFGVDKGEEEREGRKGSKNSCLTTAAYSLQAKPAT
jgi:hypothetical protein